MKSRYDGLDISVVVVRPEGEARAVLQLSHGMSGCKERFMSFMEFMVDTAGRVDKFMSRYGNRLKK